MGFEDEVPHSKSQIVISNPRSRHGAGRAPKGGGWLYSPQFPEDWERAPLYSLAEWVNGLAFRDINFSPTGKPVIKIAEIKGGISGQTKFTDQEFDDSVRVRFGDLLFSWSGQPETSIDVFWWRGPEGWLNQHVFRVTPNGKVDRTFFFYLLRYLRPNFVGIARNKQTTGLGHVTKRDLERIQAAYPPLPDQRAIARVLGTLDDKIELDRRMNETLEAIARAIFKSWFVDFDPVRAKAEGREPFGMNAETAALFPDSFEDSPLGEIPAGWRAGKVSEVVSLSREAVNPSDSRDEVFDHYSIPAYDEGRWPKAEEGEQIKSNKFLVTADAVLLSKLNPRIPRVWLPTIGNARRSIASTEFLVALPQEGSSREYIFALFSSQEFQRTFQTLVTGTSGSHQRVRPESLLAMDIVVPPRECMERFTCSVAPVSARAAGNLVESQALAAIRDALLPKLISGEVCLRQRKTSAKVPSDESRQ